MLLSSIGLWLWLLWIFIKCFMKHLHLLRFLRTFRKTCHGIQRGVEASDREDHEKTTQRCRVSRTFQISPRNLMSSRLIPLGSSCAMLMRSSQSLPRQSSRNLKPTCMHHQKWWFDINMKSNKKHRPVRFPETSRPLKGEETSLFAVFSCHCGCEVLFECAQKVGESSRQGSFDVSFMKIYVRTSNLNGFACSIIVVKNVWVVCTCRWKWLWPFIDQ